MHGLPVSWEKEGTSTKPSVRQPKHHVFRAVEPCYLPGSECGQATPGYVFCSLPGMVLLE